VKSYVVRARKVTLGDVEIEAPGSSLSNMRAGSFSDPNYEANIGSGLLKRFVVTFDYAHQRMYLKRIEPPPADAGTFDKSGMWINLGDRGFVVADVSPGGAAEAAGMAAGDVIVALDGEGSGTLALSDARRRLRARPDGTVVKLDVLRGSARETKTLTLRGRV
jgi:predicted metalloprotease with PDZ domain